MGAAAPCDGDGWSMVSGEGGADGALMELDGAFMALGGVAALVGLPPPLS